MVYHNQCVYQNARRRLKKVNTSLKQKKKPSTISITVVKDLSLYY